jgi:hypothetical protein
MNLDRSIFVPFNDCGRLGIEAVVNPAFGRADIIDYIRRGELAHDDIVKVIEFNAAEGWSRDVTDEIFAEVDAVLEAAE